MKRDFSVTIAIVSLIVALTMVARAQLPPMMGQGPQAILGSQNLSSGASGASWRLIKANSGSDTNAVATTVDTAVTGPMTALDTVMVYVNVGSVTANTAQVSLQDVTDSQGLVNVGPATLTIGSTAAWMGQVMIQEATRSNTSYFVSANGIVMPTFARSDSAVNQGGYATGWLAGYTIGLRHSGVVATGTLNWQWSVFIVKGE